MGTPEERGGSGWGSGKGCSWQKLLHVGRAECMKACSSWRTGKFLSHRCQSHSHWHVFVGILWTVLSAEIGGRQDWIQRDQFKSLYKSPSLICWWLLLERQQWGERQIGPFNRTLGGSIYRIWWLLHVAREHASSWRGQWPLLVSCLIFRRRDAPFHGEKLEKV